MEILPETWFDVQEEISVDEVEERIPSAAVDLEWLFHCHVCSGPERTYKYFQLVSVKYKEDTDLCKTFQGKAYWLHQALKAYQHQRRTRWRSVEERKESLLKW